MYTLGERPSTPNEAFDALENVLGRDEFTANEAIEVISEVLDVPQGAAIGEFNALRRVNAIVEV